MRFLLLTVVNAVAIWITAAILPGIGIPAHQNVGQEVLSLLVIAAVFTAVNSLVRPIAKFLALPFYIITLGLFFVVINGLMLLLTSWITQQLGFGLTVDSFGWAVLGGLVIGVVAALLSWVVPAKH